MKRRCEPSVRSLGVCTLARLVTLVIHPQHSCTYKFNRTRLNLFVCCDAVFRCVVAPAAAEKPRHSLGDWCAPSCVARAVPVVTNELMHIACTTTPASLGAPHCSSPPHRTAAGRGSPHGPPDNSRASVPRTDTNGRREREATRCASTRTHNTSPCREGDHLLALTCQRASKRARACFVTRVAPFRGGCAHTSSWVATAVLRICVVRGRSRPSSPLFRDTSRHRDVDRSHSRHHARRGCSRVQQEQRQS